MDLTDRLLKIYDLSPLCHSVCKVGMKRRFMKRLFIRGPDDFAAYSINKKAPPRKIEFSERGEETYRAT